MDSRPRAALANAGSRRAVTQGGLCEATLFLVRMTRPQAFTAVFFALLLLLLYQLALVFQPFLFPMFWAAAPIPFGGTALVWGPVVLYLFWNGLTATKRSSCWHGA